MQTFRLNPGGATRRAPIERDTARQPSPRMAAPTADERAPIAPAGVPTYQDVGRLRALAHSAIGLDRLDDARVVLERAIAVAPADVEVIGDLAALSLRQDDAETALALADRAIGLANGHPSSHFTRAFALVALGRTDEAQSALQSLLGGPVGEQLRRQQPALYTLAAAELARFAEGAVPDTAMPVHTLPIAARFDLLAKLLYVLHRRSLLPAWVTVDVPALYRRHQHLGAAAHGGLPDLDDGIARFDRLIDDIATRGFDASQPVRLAAADGLPVDGAHRLAVALALGLPAALQSVDAPGRRWDLAWFQRHGFGHEEVNVLLRTWVRLRGDDACVGLLWAPAESQWGELEAGLAREMTMVGARTIELPREGYEEMVRDVHAQALGPAPAAAVERRIALLRAWPARVRVVYLERRPGGASPAAKDIHRVLCQSVDSAVPAAWSSTLHLSDGPAEARHLLDLFASEHNLAMLRRRRALPESFLHRLGDLQRTLAAQALRADDACVVGDAVLAALGLRPADSIEVTLRRERRHERFDAGVATLAPGIALAPEGYLRRFDGRPPADDDTLVASPDLHFRVRGLRFAAGAVVRDRLQHDRRDADLAVLPLLAGLDAGDDRSAA